MSNDKTPEFKICDQFSKPEILCVSKFGVLQIAGSCPTKIVADKNQLTKLLLHNHNLRQESEDYY